MIMYFFWHNFLLYIGKFIFSEKLVKLHMDKVYYIYVRIFTSQGQHLATNIGAEFNLKSHLDSWLCMFFYEFFY